MSCRKQDFLRTVTVTTDAFKIKWSTGKFPLETFLSNKYFSDTKRGKSKVMCRLVSRRNFYVKQFPFFDQCVIDFWKADILWKENLWVRYQVIDWHVAKSKQVRLVKNCNSDDWCVLDKVTHAHAYGHIFYGKHFWAI